MVVGFVIKPGGPLREMTDQRVAGDLEAGDQSSHAFFFAGVDGGGRDVGDEIGVPGGDIANFITLAGAAEIALFAGESFAKNKRAVENKFIVAIQIHDD